MLQLRGSGAVLLLLHASAFGQTYVVASGGGGQFTSIAAAIGAVPDGATLHVKPGTYSDFTISGKSLTILAESVGTASVTISTQLVITGIAASQSVTISGLALVNATGLFATTPAVAVTNCAGPILLDRLSTTAGVSLYADTCSCLHVLGWTDPNLGSAITSGGLLPGLRLLRSNVEIADAAITSSQGNSLGRDGATAIEIDQCDVTLCGSLALGQKGGAFTFPYGPGFAGGDGISANGTLHVLGLGPFGAMTPCSFSGGSGSNASGVTIHFPGGHGGSGLLVRTSVAGGSTARIFGATLAFGLGGYGYPPGGPGLALSVDLYSQAEQQPGPGPSAFLTGTMLAGMLVKPSLRAAPGAPAVLLLGTTPAFSRPYPIALGALCVQPSLVVAGLTVPPTGLLEVPVQLPLSWHSDTVVLGQFLTLDPALNEVQASNSFAAVTR